MNPIEFIALVSEAEKNPEKVLGMMLKVASSLSEKEKSENRKVLRSSKHLLIGAAIVIPIVAIAVSFKNPEAVVWVMLGGIFALFGMGISTMGMGIIVGMQEMGASKFSRR